MNQPGGKREGTDPLAKFGGPGGLALIGIAGATLIWLFWPQRDPYAVLSERYPTGKLPP